MARSRRPPGPPPKRERVNEQIRISPIQVIDQSGQNLGPMDSQRALELAREADLDLVEVAPNVRPPVCKIMDYGKFKYQKSKKASESKKKQSQIKVKEVRLSPKTESHDLSVKVNRARKFLLEGDKVQFTVQFKGREIVHKDRGQKMLAQVLESLADLAIVESAAAMQQRRLIAIVAPDRKKVLAYEKELERLRAAGQVPLEDQVSTDDEDDEDYVDEMDDSVEDDDDSGTEEEFAGAESDREDGTESTG